jgi:GxxExxY protein
MKDPIMDICDIIRETSYSIHQYLRTGHLERVYENCLVHRLKKQAVAVQQQYPIDIYDEDGTAIGHFVADLLVEQQVIIELRRAGLCYLSTPHNSLVTCADADSVTIADQLRCGRA